MSDIVERLRTDYCSCHEGYKCRNMTDPACESCSTKYERTEAADEITRLRAQVAALEVDAGRYRYLRDGDWEWMDDTWMRIHKLDGIGTAEAKEAQLDAALAARKGAA